MRLKNIELKNIGLYKDQSIRFVTDNKKDVIFIWGNNGAGKTTFINSIKIGLLGDRAFSKDFSEYSKFVVNNLISTRASQVKTTASISISVEIKKDNSLHDYLINRTWKINKETFDESLSVYDKNGKLDYNTQEEIISYLSDLLPQSLLDVIIFDGENVIQILSNNKMNNLIKGIVYSVFGMDVYEKLSKDLGIYLKSTKADSSITPEEKYELLDLENNYKLLLAKSRSVRSILESEEAKRVNQVKKLKNLSNTFTRKTGVSIDEISKLSDSISEIEGQKQQKEADIKYINEEILPLKMIQKRLQSVLEKVNLERSYHIKKSISELKEYFHDSENALGIVLQLEQLVPEQPIEFKYNLNDNDFKTLTEILKVLDAYPSSKLLNNYEQRNLFTTKIQKDLDAFGKASDEESLRILSEIDALYKELEAINSGLITLKKDVDENAQNCAESKKQYELFKKNLTSRKKSSRGYTTVMLYKDAIDEFVEENIKGICKRLDGEVQKELHAVGFRNNSIDHVEISPKSFELKMFEKTGQLIPSNLFSAGEKQVLLGIVMKKALELSNNDTFFLFDTPVGRLDSKNRRLFTNNVIFTAADQVFVFATDSDYSEHDYELIKDNITKEMVLKRDDNDQIIMVSGCMYTGESEI